MQSMMRPSMITGSQIEVLEW